MLGIGLELACNGGPCGGIYIIKKRLMPFTFEKIPEISSLACSIQNFFAPLKSRDITIFKFFSSIFKFFSYLTRGKGYSLIWAI